MGQAKQRGTYEHRLSMAVPKPPKDLGAVSRKSVRMAGGKDGIETNAEFISIPRSHVEFGRAEAVVNVLNSLAATAALMAKNAQSVVFCFEGYDKDAREIYQIPEVGKFLKKVTAECPWWIFLLRPEAYIVVFGAIVKIVQLHNSGGGRIMVKFDTPQLERTAQDAMQQAAVLVRQRDIDQEVGQAALGKIHSSLKAFLRNAGGQ